MKYRNEILTIRIIHIIGAIILYSSIFVLIYSGIYKYKNSLTFLMTIFLLLEGVFILIFGECPLTRVHKIFDDKKGFFGLFLPRGYRKPAFIASVFAGILSFVFYIIRII